MQTTRSGRSLVFEDSDRLVMRNFQNAHPVLERGACTNGGTGMAVCALTPICRRDIDLTTLPPPIFSNHKLEERTSDSKTKWHWYWVKDADWVAPSQRL